MVNCFGMAQEPVQNLWVKICRQTNLGTIVEYPGVLGSMGALETSWAEKELGILVDEWNMSQ